MHRIQNRCLWVSKIHFEYEARKHTAAYGGSSNYPELLTVWADWAVECGLGAWPVPYRCETNRWRLARKCSRPRLHSQIIRLLIPLSAAHRLATWKTMPPLLQHKGQWCRDHPTDKIWAKGCLRSQEIATFRLHKSPVHFISPVQVTLSEPGIFFRKNPSPFLRKSKRSSHRDLAAVQQFNSST